MSYGSSPFGSSPYGGSSSTGSFSVTGAEAANPYTVIVTFSEDLQGSGATLDPTNYLIPGLSVLKVILEPEPNKVRLITTEQNYLLYTVTVDPTVTDIFGNPIDPLEGSVDFTGWPAQARFTARAIGKNTILVLFAQPMASGSEITDTSNYDLRDFQGGAVSILSAVPNQLSGALRVRLNLASAGLTAGKTYALTIADTIRTADNRSLIPRDTKVTWYHPKLTVSVPMRLFTGEVRAPNPKDRDPSETLVLQETLSLSVEASKPFRNTTVSRIEVIDTIPNPVEVLNLVSGHTIDAFEGRLGASTSVLGGMQLGADSVAPPTGITWPDETVQNIISFPVNQAKLRVEVTPYDPERSNFLTEINQRVVEALQVDHAKSVGADAYLVSLSETIAKTENHSSDRTRLQLVGAETLRVVEGLKVLPDPSVVGLDPSTKELFGRPDGQVFFSPALVPGVVGTSILQVDSVQTCTKAYDAYTFPNIEDPLPLYTHGGGKVPSLAGSVLGPGTVLFTNFYRLGGAKTNLDVTARETVSRPVDIGATITLTNTTTMVVAPKVNFVGPAEDFNVIEVLSSRAAHSVNLSESVSLIESTDQFPGINQVVVSLTETLTKTEGFAVT